MILTFRQITESATQMLHSRSCGCSVLTVRQDLLKLGDTGASDFKDNSLDHQHEAIAMPREFVQTNADLLAWI